MDIQFVLENTKVNVRVAGFIIKDNKILLHQIKGDPFWGIIGGKIKVNETSEEAIKREYKEELDLDINVNRMLWSIENFFEMGGTKFHELNFMYLLEGDYPHDCFETVTEKGKTVVFKWIDLKDLNHISIKPDFVKEKLLQKLPESIEHIICVDGKTK